VIPIGTLEFSVSCTAMRSGQFVEPGRRDPQCGIALLRRPDPVDRRAVITPRGVDRSRDRRSRRLDVST
jgi:hypothetical protein